MWRLDVRCVDPLRMQRVDNPVSDVGRIGSIADMLKLAPAAGREMAADWRDMIGTGLDRAVGAETVTWYCKACVTTVCCHTLPPRRNPDDQVGIAHKVAGKR